MRNFARLRNSGGLLAFAVLILAAHIYPVQAAIVTINFDSMTAGLKDSDFLSAYGITDMTIGGTGPGAGGPRVFDHTPYPYNIPPSSPNVFYQNHRSLDSGQTHSLTMQFSPELTAFSLTRMGSTATSTPVWSATFYDSSGGTLGFFGEPTWQNMPPVKTFRFTAPLGQTIAEMKLESIWTVTTFRNIMVDDFVLSPIPIPGAVWLLGSGRIGLVGIRRKFKR